MKTYPVFLVGLEGRRCVVIGGGAEAERKVDGLIDCDAEVVLVADTVSPRLAQHAGQGRIRRLARPYRDGDLRRAFLAISTDQDAATRRRIWTEAQRENVPLNTLDDTEHCSFIAGSVVRRGDLTVAISTGGAAPVLAVRLRERLERELGPEYADFLRLATALREPLARRYPDFEQRRRIWYTLVDAAI